MAKKYIDRAELISRIESEYRKWGDDYDAEQILGDIEDMPAADVAEVLTENDVLRWCQSRNYALVAKEDFPRLEVRHGRWVVEHGVLAGDGIYGDMGECSVCGLHLRNYEWDYCPNCGAKMDEVEDKSECVVGCDGYCEECPMGKEDSDEVHTASVPSGGYK